MAYTSTHTGEQIDNAVSKVEAVASATSGKTLSTTDHTHQDTEIYTTENMSLPGLTIQAASSYASFMPSLTATITSIQNNKQAKLTSTTELCSINGQSIKYGGSYTISGGGGSSETITSAWDITRNITTAHSIWVGDSENNPENLVIKIQALDHSCTVKLISSSAQVAKTFNIASTEEIIFMIYTNTGAYFDILGRTTSTSWAYFCGAADGAVTPEITATGPHIVTYYREE